MRGSAIVVHGMNSDGEGSTDLLVDDLGARGLPVRALKYRPVRFWNATRRRKAIARTLLNMLPPVVCDAPRVSVVGHSFGCLVIFTAMEMGAEFDRVVFLSAAMERRVTFPPHGMKKLLNVRNPYDNALTIGGLIPRSPLGLMGRDGYDGPKDRRIIEDQSDSRAGWFNHTAPYFADEYREHWVSRIHDFIS